MEQERENLASAILESLNAACGSWGITCIRYQVLVISGDQVIRKLEVCSSCPSLKIFISWKKELCRFETCVCQLGFRRLWRWRSQLFIFRLQQEIVLRYISWVLKKVEAERRKRAAVLESEGIMQVFKSFILSLCLSFCFGDSAQEELYTFSHIICLLVSYHLILFDLLWRHSELKIHAGWDQCCWGEKAGKYIGI